MVNWTRRFSHIGKMIVVVSFVALSTVLPSLASISSETHELVYGVFNHGGGTRSSETHYMQYDQLGLLVGGTALSPEYELQDGFLYADTQLPSAPTGSVQTGYYAKSTSATLSLTCEDSDGCSRMQFSNDNIVWSNPEAYAPSKSWSIPSGDGKKRIFVRFEDDLGNWSQVYPIDVVLDTVTPTLSITPSGGLYSTPQQVSVSSSEVSTIYYTTDGTIPTISSSVYSAPLTFSTDTILTVLVVDNAGNQKTASETYSFCLSDDGSICTGRSGNYTVVTGSVNIGSGSRLSDNNLITSDIITNQPLGAAESATYLLNGWAFASRDDDATSCSVYISADAKATKTGAVTLGLICGDASGCTKVDISNNGLTWLADPLPYSSPDSSPFVPWQLATNDGARSVYVKFLNDRGVWSKVCSDSIILDTNAPTVSASPTGGTFMSPQNIALTASEHATIYYSTDINAPTSSYALYTGPVPISANNATLKAFAVDDAGNTGPVITENYEICNGGNLTISGTVIDGTVNRPMPLVTITLNSGAQASTDINGNYSFTGLPRGYYSIVSATTASPGFVAYQERMMLCQSSLAGENAVNIVLTKDNTAFGGSTNSGYSADSVNTSTGNYVYHKSDMGIPGRGMSFVFERTYNSQDGTTGPLGYGWTHNYNTTLAENGTDVAIRWGDGKVEIWTLDVPSGLYKPMYGVYSTLIKNPDATYTVRRKDMIECRFSSAKNLAAIVDEYGNGITFTYSGTNLASITDTVGRAISVTNDANGRITSIIDPIGRSVTFTYDADGNLVRSTDLDNRATTYTYNSYHQLLTATDPKGNATVTIVYDDQRRVVASQRDALGGQTLYTYDTENKVTKIIDPLGNVSYHHFDSLLRLVQDEDAKGHSAFYNFDATRGNLESVKDKNGNITSYVYDERGNVLNKKEPLDTDASVFKESKATYDINNNPLTKTDANGNISEFTYDAKGNLLSAMDPIGKLTGKMTTYTYDDYGQLLTVTDALNNVTRNEYDVLGNKIAVVDALGNRSTFTYDAVGRKLTETHPLGRAMAYDYDKMDRLLWVADALGAVSSFGYDANGNKTDHIDANGNRTTFTYDAKNRLIRKTYPLNATENASESYSYDHLNRRISVTNARSVTTSVVYDAVGNVLEQIDAYGSAIRHEYDANGNKLKTTDALGNITTFTYDTLNRMSSTTDALGNTVRYTYDNNGNRLTVKDALGKTTYYTYDELNRLKTVKDPLNNMITNEYDALGRLIRVTDARNKATGFEYDVLGRLVTVTDAVDGVVTATYDPFGNRLSVKDTRNNTSHYTYDALNRLTLETYPVDNEKTMTRAMRYDAVGNLRYLDDARGRTEYIYDYNNRITSVLYPDMTAVTYTYDKNGNRLTVTDLTGTTTYAYDQRDAIASVTDPFGLTVRYTYDPNGNKSSIRYPGSNPGAISRPVAYYYDELNRLKAVEDWAGIATQYTYDVAGRLSSERMGNGATVTYTYDEAGRLTGKEDKNAGGAVIASYNYGLDENGNRTSMTMNQPLAPVIGAIDDNLTYNAGNQVISKNETTTYVYDGKGNRTTKDDGAVTTQYAYNFDNRMTKILKGANTEAEYFYNSAGKRISAKKNGIETRYLLDVNSGMEQILAELTAGNQVSKYYVHGAGLLYSIDGSTGARLYYHYDPLGSTVALTDVEGNVTDKYAYLPFGEPNRRETTHENPFTYVGKFGVMSEPGGLYFMRARFYDPETRQFMGVDPVKGEMNDSQSINTYAYAHGNPTRFIDANGLEPNGCGSAGSEWVPDYIGSLNLHDACNQHDTDYENGVPKAIADLRLAVGIMEDNGYSEESIVVAAIYWKAVNKRGDKAYDDAKRAREAAEARYYVDLDAGGGKIYKTEIVKSGPLLRDLPVLKSTMTPIDGSGSGGTTPAEGYTPPADTYKPPKKYINMGGYATGYFKKEFGNLLTPNFVDKQTRTYIEMSIDREIGALQSKRYGYRDSEGKRAAMARMDADLQASGQRLYSQMVSDLSKHAVIIRDLSALPKVGSGTRTTGVYGGK